MSRPILCLVTDAGPGRPEAVRAAVAAGVDWVQVRDRSLPGAALLAFVAAVAEAAARGAAERGGACTLLVNRRADVALAAGTRPQLRRGLHLGFDAMPLVAARRLWAALAPDLATIGVAAHTPEEVAAAADADYVHLAPIFDPLSKARERPALGTAALARASQLLKAALKAANERRKAANGGSRDGPRLIAQGGIDPETAAEALRAGAHGVAVTGAILGATHPGGARGAGDAAARLRATLDAAAREEG